MEGNSKLGVSDSVAEIGGPPLGGALVQLVGGPMTLLLDALSFLISALDALAYSRRGAAARATGAARACLARYWRPGCARSGPTRCCAQWLALSAIHKLLRLVLSARSMACMRSACWA